MKWKIVKGATPLSGMIFQRQRGIGYAQPTDQIWRLYVHSLRSYEWRFKMQKNVVVCGGSGLLKVIGNVTIR